ncbi:TetR family transcriptional regulator [Pseudarthrobacter psychrotolerans]|uniref:TetR family transcriptional regulator n=1 Tax=Pseudarthrobacter psychrotolerans TaxID=2697569 RepID=A0A6P1NJ54_9MICC|nr:TetR/AcrR family transcriptional regulator [Pseudarthrobacter psychrotolerans]QHK18490.1 TetR family transcriptional regulator [Pseudarthrobacter psychrotolerans]
MLLNGICGTKEVAALGAAAGVRNAKGEKRRAEILAEAERVFAELGYRGAALQTIADRAGVTQSGLLHHFPTKKKLLFALLEEHFNQDEARFQDQKRADKAIWKKLNAVVSHNARHKIWTRFFAIMTAETLTKDHPASDYMKNRYELVRYSMTVALKQDMARGAIRGDADIDALASLLIAVTDGLQLQYLHNKKIDMKPSFAILQEALDLWLAPGPTRQS